jgi:hypothetical protein
MNHCIDCKHFQRRTPENNTIALCWHPTSNGRPAARERISRAGCTGEGKNYEAQSRETVVEMEIAASTQKPITGK